MWQCLSSTKLASSKTFHANLVILMSFTRQPHTNVSYHIILNYACTISVDMLAVLYLAYFSLCNIDIIKLALVVHHIESCWWLLYFLAQQEYPPCWSVTEIAAAAEYIISSTVKHADKIYYSTQSKAYSALSYRYFKLAGIFRAFPMATTRWYMAYITTAN